MTAAEPVRPSRPGDSGYIPTLDGWRAIAVAFVIAAHLGPPADRWAVPEGGDLGVSIFFGISGLLICSRLLDEREQTGRISLRSFYIRRVFRILPPAWWYLAVTVLLAACGVFSINRTGTWAAAFFARNFLVVDGPGLFVNGHFWSLSIEEHFYLIVPAVLLLLPPQTMTRVIPLAALAVAVWRPITISQHLSLYYTIPVDGVYPSANRLTDVRFDALLWGCYAAFVWRRIRGRQWAGRAWLAVPLFVATMILAGTDWMMRYTTLALLVPVMLLATAADPRGPVGRFLEWAPLRWVGRLSYSLYLYQQLVIHLYREGHLDFLPTPFQLPVAIALLPATATASYYLLEKPMIRLGRRVADRLAPRPRT